MSAFRSGDGDERARVRELKAIGLGDFAEIVVAVEAEPSPATGAAEAAQHPGAQDACCTLTEAERSRFEAQFQLAEAEERRGSDDRPISFSSAFRLSEPGAAAAAREPRPAPGTENTPRENRFAPVLDKRADGSVREREETPRPRPVGGSGFDLSAYYDRIGAPPAEVAALARILAHEDARRGGALASDDDRRRLAEALDQLEIEIDFDRDSACASDAESELCDAIGGKDDGVAANDPLADTLREVEPLLATSGVSARALTDGRFALVLDHALARSLLDAADRQGVEAEDAAVAALRALCATRDPEPAARSSEDARLAVPEEPAIAGSAPI